MRRIETQHHPLAAIARRTAATACLATLCLLAACTADNDPGPGNDPGATGIPLVITADVAAPTPATRANTAAEQWTAGDRVAVEADGNVKVYLAATTGATTTLRPADTENTHFPPRQRKRPQPEGVALRKEQLLLVPSADRLARIGHPIR